MNDFDDKIFARFARRFAAIEHLVPERPARPFPVVTHRTPRVGALLRPLILIGAVLLLGGALVFASVGLRPAATPSPSPAPTGTAFPLTIPPDSAAPEVVLETYLQALENGECDLASGLSVPTFMGDWNTYLCGGSTHVAAFSILGGSHANLNTPTEVDIGAFVRTVTVAGNATPAQREGLVTFILQQQVVARPRSNAWRIFQIIVAGNPSSKLLPTPPPSQPVT